MGYFLWEAFDNKMKGNEALWIGTFGRLVLEQLVTQKQCSNFHAQYALFIVEKKAIYSKCMTLKRRGGQKGGLKRIRTHPQKDVQG